MKATTIYTLQFTFIGDTSSEQCEEAAKRFAECLSGVTSADDVTVTSAKVFLHDAPER
jgi:hypothetical protein